LTIFLPTLHLEALFLNLWFVIRLLIQMTTIAENKDPRALPIHTTAGESLIVKLAGIEAPPITTHSRAILIRSASID
jgi:hypothetical protein